jgi:hypothetical protein
MAQPCFAWTAAIHTSFRSRIVEVRRAWSAGVPDFADAPIATCVDGRLRGHDVQNAERDGMVSV